MGIVLEATQLPLQRRVAIKLLASTSPRSSAYQRFLREAEVVSSLDNEHVVRLLDFGTEQGDPFFVMEYLQGEDLAARLRRRHRLAPADAAGILLQACGGLAEAHQKGIVHRDLKPSNLFLTTDPGGATLVKVLDFGISKVLDAGRPELTATLSALGTAPYMSPEQIRSSRRVDQRADLWSLGVILYEMLTGRLPFQGKTAMVVGNEILSRSHLPIEELRPEVPSGLVAVVNRCLLKDRQHRFASVGELAAALGPFAQPHLAPPPGSDDAATEVMRATGFNVPRIHFTTDSSDQALTLVASPSLTVDDQALTGVIERRPAASTGASEQTPPVRPIEGGIHRPRLPASAPRPAPARSARSARPARPALARPSRGRTRARWFWLAGAGLALVVLLAGLALRR
jgi:serine/threonine protein kinase